MSTRLFISYAHRDGGDLAERLQSDLHGLAFDVWLDRQRLKGGDLWTNEIEDALDRAEVVLALLSNGSFTSDTCRAEQSWSLDAGKCVIPVRVQRDSRVPLRLYGKRAVSASRDKTLKVWDLATGRALRTLEGHSARVYGVAATPDGRRAVSTSRDRTLKVWDLETGGALRTLQGHYRSVYGVAVTPDGKRAVSASHDNTLKVWDLETGRALHTLAGHSARVYGVAVTPDGKRAVSASADHTLKVWDLETGSALRTLAGHSARVYGAAGRQT